ncbi:MAG: hypothetical protein O2807_09750 [bacterium]|nr:hypothetical protein [bacterium]
MKRALAPTVFYSRRTLIYWAAGAFLLAATIGGYALVRLKEQSEARLQIARQNLQILKKYAEELAREQARLGGQIAALQKKIRAAEKKRAAAQAPPALIVKERLFPLAKAVEISPGRLFATVARVESGRVLIRLAEISGTKEINRSKRIAPGEAWKFSHGGKSYILLVHSAAARPAGARISIRLADPAKKP